MLLADYLEENNINNIVDDYDFMLEEYEAIHNYCVDHDYILSNDDMEIIKDRGFLGHFDMWKYKYVSDLWEDFGNVPMDPDTEEIEEPWKHFLPGTHREDIWHWFEEQFDVSVAKLIGSYGKIIICI